MKALPLLGLAAALPLARGAITFDLTFVDSGGAVWTAEQATVIGHAAAEWGARFVESFTVEVDLLFGVDAENPNFLGYWQGSRPTGGGFDIRPWASSLHSITFNTDKLGSLFWDPTPATDGDLASGLFDALTVARHEFGHLLGFVGDFYLEIVGTPQQSDPWSALVDGSQVFDPGGLAVPLDADLAHVANTGIGAGDLMNATLAPTVRKSISALDVQMLTTAYDWLTPVPEPAHLGLVGGLLGLAAALAGRRRPLAPHRERRDGV